MLAEQILEVHMCGCNCLHSIEELDYLWQVLNPKNFDFADDSGFRCALVSGR